MTMILERTGSTLGDYEALSSFDEQALSRHTPVRDVASGDLRQLLTGFDIALAQPMAPLHAFLMIGTDATGTSICEIGRGAVGLSVTGILTAAFDHSLRLLSLVTTTPPELPVVAAPRSPSGAEDVVAAIKTLSWRLGLPQRDICQAADVSRSAYYSWNQPGAPHPRVASQGRLWALVQFTEDLEDLLDSPPDQWLLALPGRREQLLDGRFDQLLESLRSEPRPRLAAPDYARFLSAGADRLVPDAEPATGRRHPRNITSAQTFRRSRRPEK